MKLTVERLELAEANAFVREHHRHHKPVIGHMFSIGASLDGKIVGIAIVGRPWSVPSRPRVDKHPLQKKLLFECWQNQPSA